LKRRNYARLKELVPRHDDIHAFKARLDAPMVEKRLLALLNPVERKVLQWLHETAAGLGEFCFDWEYAEDAIRTLGSESGMSESVVHDAYDLLVLLDLVEESNDGHLKRVILQEHGPLRLIFG